MNRKNLTAAVLAGLAGAAGIAGTAQAVNINPDGLGQVLIYPYFTSNDGNQTVLSVVNTTNDAKAVKVRFLEGYNSREVLDFNVYMSPYDMWTASVIDTDPTDVVMPALRITDTTCTVPYLQGGYPGDVAIQPLLTIAYKGGNNDGGPEGIARAAEGHVEVIEMGTLVDVDGVQDFASNATHVQHVEKDKDGNVVDTWWSPADCDQLVDNWTEYTNNTPDGIWWTEAQKKDELPGMPNCNSDTTFVDGCAQAYTGTERNSGGLFGGAAVVNVDNGTMFSYDAVAVQGYDTTANGVHYEPGTIHPSLNDGNVNDATVFFGVPQNRAVTLYGYDRSVDAVTAVFMHEHIMNEYNVDQNFAASTEWVVTFPTKSFYVDEDLLHSIGSYTRYWSPDPTDPGCGWKPGDKNPAQGYHGQSAPGPDVTGPGWEQCTFVFVDKEDALAPFTDTFDGKACEDAQLLLWDREERDPPSSTPGGSRPPVVSPSEPGCDPDIEQCGPGPKFQLCYEVNVLRFGDGVVFGTPEIEGSSLLLELEDNPFDNGWAAIDLWSADDDHMDKMGLVGLPATGFAAMEYENASLGGGTVKAFYGGLFGHKANVRRVPPPVVGAQ